VGIPTLIVSTIREQDQWEGGLGFGTWVLGRAEGRGGGRTGFFTTKARRHEGRMERIGEGCYGVYLVLGCGGMWRDSSGHGGRWTNGSRPRNRDAGAPGGDLWSKALRGGDEAEGFHGETV
jgi:hypothetical protein